MPASCGSAGCPHSRSAGAPDALAPGACCAAVAASMNGTRQKAVAVRSRTSANWIMSSRLIEVNVIRWHGTYFVAKKPRAHASRKNRYSISRRHTVLANVGTAGQRAGLGIDDDRLAATHLV